MVSVVIPASATVHPNHKRHTAGATAVFWSAVTLRESNRAALGRARSRAALAALLRPSTVDGRSG